MTRTAHLTRLALLIALTAAVTMAVRIPVPRTGGYINLGDAVVYVTALLFGPVYGLVAGGIGSSLADFLGGYGVYAPFTLVIKALEGLVVGSLAWRAFHRHPRPSGVDLVLAGVAVGVGGAVMVLGYFVAEAFVLHLGVGAAASEVPGNIFQVLGGLVAALPVSLALRGLGRSGWARE
jgi:uncharacterized membrane protein